MAGRPLAPLLAELGMRFLNRAAVLPLRRLVVGEDAWSEFFELGHDGHPWWWYQEGPDGTLILVGPIGSRSTAPMPQRIPPPPIRPRATASGASVPMSLGRTTTPIEGYQPEVHDDLIAELDLLCALMYGDDVAGSRGGVRSPSLAARAWGTRTGRSQRRADRYLTELGAAGILERTVVGSRAEWHVPPDALARFQAVHGFTVAC